MIQTKRCTIRAFEESDIDDFMLYRNDLRWMQYQGFKGLDKSEYRKSLLENVSVQNGMQFAIINLETKKLIGDIYLKQEKSVYWIGYSVSPQYARRGFAFESVSAFIDWLKNEKTASCVKAGVHPENTASIALLKKLHFKYEKTLYDEQIFVLQLQ
jgi:RimJ/RimL family protein N-acetyltransferase